MKIKLVIIFAIAFGFLACENQETEFPDFGSTSVFFPFQTPVRTLIQGKYDLGFNDNDNNGRFEIGVVMSGVFENTKDRKVFFELAPELIDPTNLGATGVNVQVLPESYYTIEQESPVTIPAGSINGRIPIQLTDAFFDDPLSFFPDKDSVNYVLPLKITGFEDLDSLLTGVPAEGVIDPKRVRNTDWVTLPKDYTLFGIKFMNKYQGIYLRRGEDKVVGTSQTIKVRRNTGEVVESGDILNIDDSTIYRSENVVQNELDTLFTVGRSKSLVSNPIRRPGLVSNTSITLELIFDNNEDISIKNADENSDFIVTGSGKFVENGDEWGGKKQDVIYLEYTYQDKVVETSQEGFFFDPIDVTSTVDLLHTVNDTLVIRNRDVRFEEFVIEIEE
jgi:hypothetical protein